MAETIIPPEAASETAETGPKPRETSIERILPALEAVLFSSPRPVREKDLADLLEAAPGAVSAALERLAASTDSPERGVRLEKVAGGWRFVTRPEFDALLRKFHEVTERSRLSLAALETLAIIAYRQPITLPEIQDIRGVNSSSVLKTLFEKKLITTAGKKPVVGTPFFYRTTQDFLVRFGLNELSELPQPEDLDADLAATVGAREIAAPTALAPKIRVDRADAEGDGDRTGEDEGDEEVEVASGGEEDEEEEFDDDDEDDDGDDEDDDDEDDSDDDDAEPGSGPASGA